MVKCSLYILTFEDMPKAADVVYDPSKRKAVEGCLGAVCKMRIEWGKVKVLVDGEVEEDRLIHAIEDTFQMEATVMDKVMKDVKVGNETQWEMGRDVWYELEEEGERKKEEEKKERKERVEGKKEEREKAVRHFNGVYYLSFYGIVRIPDKEGLSNTIRDLLGSKFALVDSVKGFRDISGYSVSLFLRAIDYGDAHDIFTLGLDTVRDAFVRAVGHQPMRIRIGRITDPSDIHRGTGLGLRRRREPAPIKLSSAGIGPRRPLFSVPRTVEGTPTGGATRVRSDDHD